LAQKVRVADLHAELSRLLATSEAGRIRGAKGSVPDRGTEAALQRTFLDTNVLLYADDSKDKRKQQIALALILEHRRQRTGVVSIQVLQELFVNLTGKLGVDLSLARYKVEFYSRFQVVEPTSSAVISAIDLHRLYRVSFWDALILHSAKQSGCRILLTEDMQHGQTIEGVRIVNPFR
jgi:predicted nucleic acid-binding protein